MAHPQRPRLDLERAAVGLISGSPVEGAADYGVRVTDPRGQVRFQDTVKGTQIALPPTYSSKQECLGWK